MVECPKCGAKVEEPIKSWSMSKDPGETGAVMMGLYECSKCNARFRAAVRVEERTSIKSMVQKIMGVEGKLMQTLKNLREKIKTLETERADLLVEIEGLKKKAQAKVDDLESEVSMLKMKWSHLKNC